MSYEGGMRTRGIEPRLEPWKGAVLTTILCARRLTCRNRTSDLKMNDHPEQAECLQSFALPIELRSDGGNGVSLQPPGLEPGFEPWKGSVLPLDYGCCF